jgi:hypothetical protein
VLDRDTLRAQRGLAAVDEPALLVLMDEPNHAASTSSDVPVASSSCFQRVRARQASRIYQVSAPCPNRITRERLDEVARSLPGSSWSTRVTCHPSPASWLAMLTPKIPAPTMIALLLISVPQAWVHWPRISPTPFSSWPR